MDPSLGGQELRNMTANEASQWILQHTPTTFQVRTVFLFDEKYLSAKTCVECSK